MTSIHRKPLAAALVVALGLIAPAIHAQTDYPNRPMRMIVAFPPGAGADLTARTVAQKLSEAYGHPVVVDNRAGANGSVGTDAVAKSAPDGYTLLLTDRGALGINPSLYTKLPYDPTRDFDYIGIATVGAYVLVANAAVGASTLDDLVRLAKAKPDTINYASYGIGSMPHLNFEALNQRLGIKLTHVPYKGGAPAVAAAVAGEVGVTIATPPSLLGHIRDGRVRALAIGAPRRSPLLPNVPTMAEAGGGEDTLAFTFFGFAAAAGSPRPVIARLSTDIKRILAQPDVAERLSKVGLDPLGSTPEEMLDTVKRDVARFAKLVSSIGIQPE